MNSAHVGTARGILRNAAALFLVGAFAKGAGLVIAILVARFLGPDAMGLYALLFSVAFLLETFISLGMSDSLVRDVAARPAEARQLYFSSLKLVSLIGLAPAAILVIVAFFFIEEGAARASLLVIAAGAPVSGAFVVSQAAIQGKERVLFLTWVTFLVRLVTLGLLTWALYRGAGIAAAFGARVLYQAGSMAFFFGFMRSERKEGAGQHSTKSLLSRSVPFAMNKAMRELGVRLPSFVLPGVLGLGAAGIFDAANRLRSTLGMIMSAGIVGLMPAFARNLGRTDVSTGAQSELLIGFSMKYMCIGMSLLATVIALLSHWIIRVLYGSEFAPAAMPLQLLVWAQVLVAVDAVLQQAMLASGSVLPAVRHSAAGVVAQLVLIFLFTTLMGLAGAAVAVLLACAVTLALDLHFVSKNVTAVPVRRFAVAPLAVAVIVACSMLVADHISFALRLLIAIGSWCVAMALFRVLPREELRFILHLAMPGRARATRDP